jgi:hypothetical protein
VTTNPKAEWIAHQIADAFPWNDAPDYLIRDREGWVLWSDRHRALAARGIRDHPIAPRSPWQNGHAERLIGSICRGCLDHIVIFGKVYMRHVLSPLAITTNSEHICPWTKTRQVIGRFGGSTLVCGVLQDSVSCTVNLFFIKMFP